MRNILISSALILSLAGGASAFAATKPAADTTATKPAATSTKQAAAKNPKAAECSKQWKAEKKHTQTHKAFMAACEKAA